MTSEQTTTDRHEFQLIAAIADRFLKIAPLHKKIDVMMDIEYAHAETPLDLDKLLTFENGDFAHDLFGIVQNFNRQTKSMDNCFLPRCASI